MESSPRCRLVHAQIQPAMCKHGRRLALPLPHTTTFTCTFPVALVATPRPDWSILSLRFTAPAVLSPLCSSCDVLTSLIRQGGLEYSFRDGWHCCVRLPSLNLDHALLVLCRLRHAGLPPFLSLIDFYQKGLLRARIPERRMLTMCRKDFCLIIALQKYFRRAIAVSETYAYESDP